jgi:hypothetical protein
MLTRSSNHCWRCGPVSDAAVQATIAGNMGRPITTIESTATMSKLLLFPLGYALALILHCWFERKLTGAHLGWYRLQSSQVNEEAEKKENGRTGWLGRRRRCARAASWGGAGAVREQQAVAAPVLCTSSKRQ